MRLKYAIMAMSILSLVSTYGQTGEIISSDRPGQSFGPLTTGKKILQIQNGINYSKFDINKLNTDGHTLQNFLSIRYGIWENIGVRTDIAYNNDNTTNNDLNTELNQNGISQWSFGVKYDILEDHPTGPAIGILGIIDTKWVDNDYKPLRTTQHIILVISHNWTDRLTTTTNLGLNATPKYSYNNYTMNVGYTITDNLFGFIESYGEMGSIIDGYWDNRWNAGFGYFVSNDLQMDCSAGMGNNDDIADWFIDAGISWRIKLY